LGANKENIGNYAKGIFTRSIRWRSNEVKAIIYQKISLFVRKLRIIRKHNRILYVDQGTVPHQKNITSSADEIIRHSNLAAKKDGFLLHLVGQFGIRERMLAHCPIKRWLQYHSDRADLDDAIGHGHHEG
jgi:hypothetical protein